MRTGSLFSGYGGLDMAVNAWAGATTAWVSDIDPGACKILAHRHPGVPNLGDITTVDWSTVEPVDILTGGFPCQDLSHAGKRAGLRPGTRSGLWAHMAYAIDQLRPRYVVAENVRGLLSATADSDVEPCPWCVGGSGDGEPDLRALGAVLGDLAGLGYDAQWIGLRAADVGAPHGRFRVFIVATTDADRATGGQRRFAAPGQEEAGRARADAGRRGGAPTTDADDPGSQGTEPAGRRNLPDRGATPDPKGDGWHQGRPEPTGLIGGPDAAQRGDAAANAGSERHGRGQDACCRAVHSSHTSTAPNGRCGEGQGHGCSAWGRYAPAVHRWEIQLGRLAPAPTELSPKGSARLSPRAVEWLMGLPDGWVCDVPDLNRNAQLKALGNGVVPQQAYEALTRMSRWEAVA